MTAVYAADGRLLIATVHQADSTWQRARGLIGRPALQPGEALLLAPCRSIHSLFMGYPLDLIFFARDGRVVRRYIRLLPWRMAWGGWQAFGVLELASGWLAAGRVQPDDYLTFADTPAERAAV